MSIDYFRCEVCGAQLMYSDSANENKFPITRRFQDQVYEKGLLSVRCAECTNLPYKLEEGQPYRSHLIGRDKVHVASGCNSVYNYWPHGVGHLLEVFSSSPSNESLSFIRSTPIEVGFLVEEDVNLIIVAYRFVPHKWNVTPYLWHAYKEPARANPPDNPASEAERKFTVALVNTNGGKYLVIREGILPLEFATTFHSAIHNQIARGVPQKQEYGARVNRLSEFLIDNRVDSMLEAKAIIQ